MKPTPQQCTLFIAWHVINRTWRGKAPFNRDVAALIIEKNKKLA